MRVQEITVGERFEPRNLELFDPAAQQLYQGFTCKNFHNIEAEAN
jgi:hypothetical protein